LGRQNERTVPRRKPADTETAETPITDSPIPEQMSEAPAEKTVTTTRAKGTPLPLDQIKATMAQMEGQPIDAVAKACGFYTEITDNATGAVEIRVTAADSNAFLTASLEALSGVKLAAPVRSHRRTNRSPVVKIGKTGNIVVGGRHTSIAGFPFGEDVDSYVKIEAAPGQIIITAGVKEVTEQTEVDLNAEEDDEAELDL
jgi:hypothetical protein